MTRFLVLPLVALAFTLAACGGSSSTPAPAPEESRWSLALLDELLAFQIELTPEQWEAYTALRCDYPDIDDEHACLETFAAAEASGVQLRVPYDPAAIVDAAIAN